MVNFLKKLILWISKPQFLKFDKLYQLHAGEECYLFGDGISIKWMDLSSFTDKLAIMGNFSVYHKQMSILNAPYCTVIEPYFFYPFFVYRGNGKWQILRQFLHIEYKKLIKKFPKKSFFLNISNYPALMTANNTIFIQKNYIPPFNEKNPFKDRTDACEGTFKFQISLAIYLGFKKVYLIGHDYTHYPSKSFHFYEKGKGERNDIREFNKDFIEYALKYIEIITITIDGKSEVLDYTTYNDFTSRVPHFQENTEIVDEVILNNLATWYGYQIF